jgi:hypothetical protein
VALVVSNDVIVLLYQHLSFATSYKNTSQSANLNLVFFFKWDFVGSCITHEYTLSSRGG